MQEANDYIKTKSEEISKHITKEHQKLVERLIEYKKRT